MILALMLIATLFIYIYGEIIAFSLYRNMKVVGVLVLGSKVLALTLLPPLALKILQFSLDYTNTMEIIFS